MAPVGPVARPVRPTAPQVRPRGSTLRTLAALFALSLAVRLAVWGPVVWYRVPPVYDEIAYLERARAYQNIIVAYLRGGLFGAQPDETDLKRAYYRGAWPPLHPLLIALGFFVGGRSLAVARLVVVLQSAATTCVIYLLVARLTRSSGPGPPRAQAAAIAPLAAAVLHGLYPSFVAYAHLLWSETTYILACLGALYWVVRAADEQRRRQQLCFAVLCGICLGLAGLARATVLPLLVIVPAWLLWTAARRGAPGQWPAVAKQHNHRRLRRWRDGLLLLPAVLVPCVLVLAPWEATLLAREKRFVLLSAKSGHYLYERNNPHLGRPGAQRRIREEMDAYARRHGVSRDEAGRALALEHIRRQPGLFLRRCLARARALWSLDWYLLRHVLTATYPPLSAAGMLLVFLAVAASLPLLIGPAVYGLCARTLRCRGLLLGCLLLGAVPNVVCVANSRLAQPLLALLLVPAGVGWAELVRKRSWQRGVAALAGAAAALWALNPTLPEDALGIRQQASAYYRGTLRRLARVFDGRIETQDRLLFRYAADKPPGHVRLALPGEAYQFRNSDARWVVLPDGSPGTERRVTLRAARVPTGPLALDLTLVAGGSSAAHRPRQVRLDDGLRPDAWRRWRPTGLPGVEYFWAGTVGLSERELDELWRQGSAPAAEEP